MAVWKLRDSAAPHDSRSLLSDDLDDQVSLHPLPTPPPPPPDCDSWHGIARLIARLWRFSPWALVHLAGHCARWGSLLSIRTGSHSPPASWHCGARTRANGTCHMPHATHAQPHLRASRMDAKEEARHVDELIFPTVTSAPLSPTAGHRAIPSCVAASGLPQVNEHY